MKSHFRKLIVFITLLGLSTVALFAQTGSSPKAAPSLTDAQAKALFQRLVTAPANSPGLSPEESRNLVQYIATKSHFAPDTRLTSSEAAPKPEVAKIKIGLVTPKAQMGQGSSIATPLRGLIQQYISGPSVEVIAISAMLPQQIEEEAKEKQCAYVVDTSISQKKSGGSFLKGATSMAGMVPMLGAARGMAGAVAAASSAAAAQQAAAVSSSVKAKNEVSFDYKLTVPGNTTPVLSSTLKAKANSDGEDVVTPLVEEAATAIMAEVTKKK